ncbi:hypothetical protein [Polyangium jinanense]|uniref:Uncharacterized protein n=1 Tax=Polyangium jinanense TaxID=2829994 RepID=A0A9X4AWH0_9BACT|nr:hypothetical protein [Polyangium jinanense]MDC3958707.1 hypothetical protein [Polyangium jinanense]MDC3985312.1 hypothetical protein [Polyangium jinanense]
MRNQPPFSCPQCGDTGLGGDKCLRCKLELVDKAGVPALSPPAVFLGHPTFAAFVDPWARWIAIIAFVLTFFTSHQYGTGNVELVVLLIGVQVVVWGGIYAAYRSFIGARIKRLRARLRVLQARIASAPAVAPIGSASGVCRVRGRVRVLEPVKGPLGQPVAAFLERRKRQTVGLVSAKRGTQVEAVTAVTVEELSAAGVFLVEDESGTALVDDDAFVVAQLGGTAKDWNEPLSIVVNDGDEIEVFGPAEWRSGAGLPGHASQGGYRDGGNVLAFDGKPAERVVILAKSAAVIVNA